MTTPLQCSVWWEKKGVWNLNSSLDRHNRRDFEGQKVKSINVNYWWNMGDASTKSRYILMIGIWDKYFHFIPVIMLLYIYKYWFKILKRLKFPPLIKARELSTNCTMGNLTCSRPTQHTYIQSMLNLTRFISFNTMQILGFT